MVLAVLVGALIVWRGLPSQEASAAPAQQVQDSLARLYERASYYGALENSLETTRTLWPVAVLPEWFGHDLPRNRILPGVNDTDRQGRPWIDVAPPGDDSPHPPDPVAVRKDQAQFWYNPNVGVFRARVPATLGEGDALALYNQLNGVELEVLDRDTNPDRIPLAYTPGRAPSTSLASRDSAADEPSSATLTTRETVVADIHRPVEPSLFRPEPVTHYPGLEPETEPEPAKPRGRARLKDPSTN